MTTLYCSYMKSVRFFLSYDENIRVSGVDWKIWQAGASLLSNMCDENRAEWNIATINRVKLIYVASFFVTGLAVSCDCIKMINFNMLLRKDLMIFLLENYNLISCKQGYLYFFCVSLLCRVFIIIIQDKAFKF